MGQPERGDPGAVDPLPEELRREILPGHAPEEPEALEPAEREQLRHLGVVPEGVEEPAGRHVDPELVAIIPLAVLHLPDERLAAGHVVVGHDVERPGELQPPFGQEPAEIRLLGRVPLEERPDVGHLVEREPEAGLFSQEPHRLEDVRQAHVQVFLAGLEDRPLPVGVRDDPEGLLLRIRGLGLLGPG